MKEIGSKRLVSVLPSFLLLYIDYIDGDDGVALTNLAKAGERDRMVRQRSKVCVWAIMIDV